MVHPMKIWLGVLELEGDELFGSTSIGNLNYGKGGGRREP